MVRRFLPLAGICVVLYAAGPLAAQSSPDSLEPGWHIVRPGDTLEALADLYLGSSQFWKRLALASAEAVRPEVEAGGARVQVPQGMGTSVEKEGRPGPPEPLLPAPRLASPADGAAAVCANPRLAWEPVPESASYTVEVCRDPACAELVERAAGVEGTEWRASALPAGAPAEYHWRVTARSRSGLDGYPSATSRLVVRPGEVDTAPPTGSIRITGTTVRIADQLYVPPSVTFEVEAADGGSGLSGWRPVIDGKDAEVETWTGPWPAGPHRAGATALDLCGNRGPIAPVSFVVDAEPPALSWKAEGPPPEQLRSRRGWRLRRGRPGDEPGLLWAPSDPWGRLRWDERWSSSPAGTVHQTVQVASDLPTIFLRLEGVRLLADGKPLPASADGLVRLDAVDGGSRVEKLTVRTRSTADGPVLEVEAVDGAGNAGRQELRIERSTTPAG